MTLILDGTCHNISQRISQLSNSNVTHVSSNNQWCHTSYFVTVHI